MVIQEDVLLHPLRSYIHVASLKIKNAVYKPLKIALWELVWETITA